MPQLYETFAPAHCEPSSAKLRRSYPPPKKKVKSLLRQGCLTGVIKSGTASRSQQACEAGSRIRPTVKAKAEPWLAGPPIREPAKRGGRPYHPKPLSPAMRACAVGLCSTHGSASLHRGLYSAARLAGHCIALYRVWDIPGARRI
jgi:hypothetical protein